VAYKVVLTYDVGPTDAEEKALGEVGAELIKADWKTEDELVRICRDTDAIAVLIGPATPITKRVIDAMPNLKIVTGKFFQKPEGLSSLLVSYGG